MGVRVQVLWNCPLGTPGVAFVREGSIWYVMVDRDTPQDVALLAIDFFESLATLANQDSIAEDDGDAEDAAPSLPRRRPARWTTRVGYPLAGAVVGALATAALLLPGRLSGNAAPGPGGRDHPATSVPAPATTSPPVSSRAAIVAGERTYSGGEVVLATGGAIPLRPSTRTSTIVVTPPPSPAPATPRAQPCGVLCRLLRW